MVNFIADTAITSIQEVRLSSGKEVSEKDILNEELQLILGGEDLAQEIEIDYTLLPNLHPSNFSVEEQRKDIKSLTSNEVKENVFTYKFISGFVSINSISVDEKSDLNNIRRGTISGYFLPWPKYYSENAPFVGYGSGTYGKGVYKG